MESLKFFGRSSSGKNEKMVPSNGIDEDLEEGDSSPLSSNNNNNTNNNKKNAKSESSKFPIGKTSASQQIQQTNPQSLLSPSTTTAKINQLHVHNTRNQIYSTSFDSREIKNINPSYQR